MARYTQVIIAFISGVFGFPIIVLLFSLIVLTDVPVGEIFRGIFLDVFQDPEMWFWTIPIALLVSLLVIPFRNLPTFVIIFGSPLLVASILQFIGLSL
jgi:hypothetical protein